MDLKGIISVSGQSGLFRTVSQGKNNMIVESLETGKKMPVYAQTRVSGLEDISVFTEGDDLALAEVFRKIAEKENKGPAPGSKLTNDQIKAYFASVLPDYNRDKVYVSDMKKILLWYNILQTKGMIDLEPKAEENPSTEETSQDSPVEE